MIILPEPVYTEYRKECSIITQKYNRHMYILVHACTHNIHWQLTQGKSPEPILKKLYPPNFKYMYTLSNSSCMNFQETIRDSRFGLIFNGLL